MLNIGMLKQTVAALKIISSVASFILVREFSRSGGGMAKPSYKPSISYKQSSYKGRTYGRR